MEDFDMAFLVVQGKSRLVKNNIPIIILFKRVWKSEYILPTIPNHILTDFVRG